MFRICSYVHRLLQSASDMFLGIVGLSNPRSFHFTCADLFDAIGMRNGSILMQIMLF